MENLTNREFNIELSGVSFKYNGEDAEAVKDLSLKVSPGEFVAVIGRNGSGKSTLAKLINCLLLPNSGEVLVNGLSTSDKANQFEIRKSAGMVFQNPDNQMVASIVEDDIAFGPENIGLPREEIGKRIDYALKAVGMEEFRHSTPTRLSGGQKQRIAIAGVLAIKPEILILDESTAMLDPKGRKEVMDVVKKLNKDEKMTILHITHYMEEAAFADKVIVMNRGEIALSGKPSDVFKREEELKAYGLSLPKPVKYALELKRRGIDLTTDILYKEEFLKALCESLRII